MNYLDVCSGISAPTVAWKPLGYEAVAYSEIEKAPSAVLAHHYPETPNWGDMTKYQEWPDADVNLLVGGTPCQSFSIAGLRAGLADPRGNLMLTYLGIADRYRPRWLVWENVPGVLSSNKGRDFGTFLGALGELGYGFAYRVLDAQYFGVAQRRERVFVVGHLGDWRRAAEVLFERESLSRYPAPRREAGKDVAPTLSARTRGGGGLGTDFDCDGGLIAFGGNNTAGAVDVATALNACGTASGRMDFESETFIAHTLRADGFDASEDGTGRGTPLVPIAIQERAICENPNSRPDGASQEANLIAFSCKDYGADAGDLSPTLRSMGHDKSHANAGGQVAIVFHENQRGEVTINETAGALNSGGGKPGQGYTAVAIQERATCENPHAGPGGVGVRTDGLAYTLEARSVPQAIMDRIWRVRRIMPVEAERLQGFPDGFTQVPYRGKPMADGPRYKMLGNSMAVPVIRKIGQRIAMIDQLECLEVSA